MSKSSNRKRNIAKPKTAVSTVPAPIDSFAALSREERVALYRAVAADHQNGALGKIETALAELRLTLTEAHSELIGGIR